MISLVATTVSLGGGYGGSHMVPRMLVGVYSGIVYGRLVCASIAFMP